MKEARPLRAFVALATLAVAVGVRAEEVDSESAIYDCGTRSLYAILRLEGRSCDLTALSASLPSPAPLDGYSLLQLREAARRCGLDSMGVALKRSESACDRPILAYVKRNGHGHFLVVRPVGHTGRLVQVIDGYRPPEVLDAADLYASPEWTGLALIPTRPNWPAWIAATVAAAGVLALAATWPFRRRPSLVLPTSLGRENVAD